MAREQTQIKSVLFLPCWLLKSEGEAICIWQMCLYYLCKYCFDLFHRVAFITVLRMTEWMCVCVYARARIQSRIVGLFQQSVWEVHKLIQTKCTPNQPCPQANPAPHVIDQIKESNTNSNRWKSPQYKTLKMKNTTPSEGMEWGGDKTNYLTHVYLVKTFPVADANYLQLKQYSSFSVS